jgi:predicted O-methyltransferase YrrM
MIEYYILFL